MRVRWLGRVPYREAWALQRALCRRSEDDFLLLLEHPHVYTLGSNADADHILVEPASVGADSVKTDRGGDVTYHGPGQLVGYPIVTVGPGLHRGPDHVRRVEQVVIDALVTLGLRPDDVGRLDGYPGVWVGLDPAHGTGPRKICAIGVRTTRGRTLHGFALNVHPDLAMFEHIVPCGIADKPVTSLAAEGIEVSMAEAADAVIGAALAVWGPVEDTQRVTDGAGVEAGVPVALRRPPTEGRSLDRRLRRSGVDPDAGLPIQERKPPWLRVQAHMGEDYLGLRHQLRDLDLVTVCEEAGCPNIYECWSDGTATFMINGSRCTRACGFCLVDTRHPLPLDPDEPARVARAVARMGLAHAVITCVARDDLDDGGAGGFAAAIQAVRSQSPRTAIEVLISDCKGDEASLRTVFDARPDVLNHNIETVARLQRAVRPSAGYARSLAVLARSKDAGLTTKSGMILGMGEREDEVLATLADLRAVGVDIVTMGQYLRPSSRHLPVARWLRPEEFDSFRDAGMAMGFSHVQASPLTRSSYHAREAAEATTPVAAPVPVRMGTAPAAPATTL
ncbi:MAG TPA: lipoyl synthase [Acidimicrobiales bacterium]|jgi:lipoic acid synthetase|nr:lipoyl synthase [Acidimicrobiales bacterium]